MTASMTLGRLLLLCNKVSKLLQSLLKNVDSLWFFFQQDTKLVAAPYQTRLWPWEDLTRGTAQIRSSATIQKRILGDHCHHWLLLDVVVASPLSKVSDLARPSLRSSYQRGCFLYRSALCHRRLRRYPSVVQRRNIGPFRPTIHLASWTTLEHTSRQRQGGRGCD